jgi:FAD/FMN-containing dehydrogenase
LPNGTFTTVSETQDPDIFYALQGGTNNFGIVTSFTLRTFPVGKVWGGTILYSADQLDAMIDATVEYSKATLATQFFATNGSTTGAASE